MSATARPRRTPRPSTTLVLGGGVTLLFVLVAILAPWLAPHDPFRVVGPALAPPSAEYPMGTDGIGRDVLSGILLGTRTSLAIAAAVGLLTGAIGVLIGALGGYLGGRIDDALLRVTELVQVLPRFFLAILVLALFGPGTDRLVVVLALTAWPLLARVVRSQVLVVVALPFIEAARATGARAPRILLRHVLPNAVPTAMTTLGVVLAQVILLEASLGFLGLGDPSTMSLGALAGEAQRFLRRAWWLSVFPGGAIVLIVLGVNLLIDAGVGVRTPRRRWLAERGWLPGRRWLPTKAAG
ncbi:MAG: ABC transporter permease [Nitriliruptoraceae bacterium]